MILIFFIFVPRVTATETQVDSIRQLVKRDHIQGELLITDQGQNGIRYESFGHANQLTGQKNSPATLFPIASLQKAITAIVVGKLVEQGKLTMQTQLSDFYPNISHANKITIRMLLDHRSGIRMQEQLPAKILQTEKQQLNFTMTHLHSTGQFNWDYSDANYTLLAGIISQITRQSYAQNVQNDVIEPLHLKHIFFWNQLPKKAVLAQPVSVFRRTENSWLNQKNRLMSAELGAGNMYSTVFDYDQIISAICHDRLLQASTTQLLADDGKENYAAGLYYDHENHLHTHGADNGFETMVDVSENARIAAILFVNQGSWQTVKLLNNQIFLKLVRDSHNIPV